jgi:hypothetical protein
MSSGDIWEKSKLRKEKKLPNICTKNSSIRHAENYRELSSFVKQLPLNLHYFLPYSFVTYRIIRGGRSVTPCLTNNTHKQSTVNHPLYQYTTLYISTTKHHQYSQNVYNLSSHRVLTYDNWLLWYP